MVLSNEVRQQMSLGKSAEFLSTDNLNNASSVIVHNNEKHNFMLMGMMSKYEIFFVHFFNFAKSDLTIRLHN